jgi:hypothetical protein
MRSLLLHAGRLLRTYARVLRLCSTIVRGDEYCLIVSLDRESNESVHSCNVGGGQVHLSRFYNTAWITRVVFMSCHCIVGVIPFTNTRLFSNCFLKQLNRCRTARRKTVRQSQQSHPAQRTCARLQTICLQWITHKFLATDVTALLLCT